MLPPARGTLAWRLYVLGSMQLVLLAVAVVGVGQLIAPHRPPPPADSPFPAPAGPPPGGPPHDRGPPGPLAPLLTFFFSGLAIVGVGSFLTARWILQPLDALSRAARAFGAGDLRARARLTRSDELGDVGRVFDEMADRVQQLRTAERELLANVSHELRTPLARIRVALDIVGESRAADGAASSLAEIATDLSEIETLIDDILTATRLDLEGARATRVGFELHLVETSADEICERAAARFRSLHPSRPLDVTIAGGTPRLRVDRVLFRRVIDNLLENADKYTPEPRAPIALRVRPGDRDAAVFEVEDPGVGIRSDDLSRVFTPFFRGERSRSRGTGGVGLGLTLAKRIVEAHGGTIGIVSAAAVGTTVRVTLAGPAVVSSATLGGS